MSSRLLTVLIIFPIWLTLVLIFRKHRQWLLYYLAAAFGLTLQLVFLAEHFGFDQVLVNVASFHVDLISKIFFHLPIELMTNGRFQLLLPSGASSILKLGIECSAVLESSIVVSLILFYPLFNPAQKILRATFGLVVTYVINIIRLMIIVLMAYKFGPDYIFLAHAGVARVFFFACELLLYWYLMTKPTVKSVGVSIKEGKPLSEVATVGRALKLRNALTQITVIMLVVGLSISSFKLSDEWQKAFVPVAKVERPIVYLEETDLTAAAPPAPEASGSASQMAIEGLSTTSLDKEITLNLMGGEKSRQRFEIRQAEELNIQVIEGQEDLAARLILNGESVELVTLPPWLFNKETSIFKPFTVKPGDVLELKFQNLAEEPSEYLIKIFGNGESVSSPPIVQPQPPQPTSPPLSQGPTFKDKVIKSITDLLIRKRTVAALAQKLKSFERTISEKVLRLLIARKARPIVYQEETDLPLPVPSNDNTLKSIAGVSSGSDHEMSFDLTGGGKASLKFEIRQAEELNIQVIEGQEDLAARLILNGESVELVTLPPWLFNKETSIFKPFTVKPGDVLELKFQNLAEEPSEYLIKIFGTGGQSE